MQLVAQAHGGALQVGNPGNSGGGRPRSIIRDDVLLSFDGKSREFLDQVVTGEIVSKMRIPVLSVTKYLKCMDCSGKNFGPVEGALSDLLLVDVEVGCSATVSQRLDVAEMQMRYGLGAVKEITVDNVRERVNRTLDALQSMMSKEQYLAACKVLEPIWA